MITQDGFDLTGEIRVTTTSHYYITSNDPIYVTLIVMSNAKSHHLRFR